MIENVTERWRAILEHNGLKSFADFWQVQADEFEPANVRRGGWSAVSRLELQLPEGGSVGVFLKRQENHRTRVWRHPLRGIPTLVKEMRNLLSFYRRRIPAPTLIYAAKRSDGGACQAVLLTEELAGFRSLESLTQEWEQSGWPPLSARRRLIAALAQAVRAMHECRFIHNCLQPKHVFVGWPLRASPDATVEIRLIDLEKCDRGWGRWRSVLRDLDTLSRYLPGWRPVDRLRFLKCYLGPDRLGELPRLWRRLAGQAWRKYESRRRRRGPRARPPSARWGWLSRRMDGARAER